MGGTGARRVRDSLDESGPSHRVIRVPPPDEPTGDREPLEDGAVSKARNACRESGGVVSIRRGMRDRTTG